MCLSERRRTWIAGHPSDRTGAAEPAHRSSNSATERQGDRESCAVSATRRLSLGKMPGCRTQRVHLFRFALGRAKYPCLACAICRSLSEWVYGTAWHLGSWTKRKFGGEIKRRFHWIYSFHATNWPADEAYSDTHVRKRLKEWFLRHTWDNIYDFVEAIPNMVWYGVGDPDPNEFKRDNPIGYEYVVRVITTYKNTLNQMLERHGAPSRRALIADYQ
jgi:hypothetical protein